MQYLHCANTLVTMRML